MSCFSELEKLRYLHGFLGGIHRHAVFLQVPYSVRSLGVNNNVIQLEVL